MTDVHVKSVLNLGSFNFCLPGGDGLDVKVLQLLLFGHLGRGRGEMDIERMHLLALPLRSQLDLTLDILTGCI